MGCPDQAETWFPERIPCLPPPSQPTHPSLPHPPCCCPRARALRARHPAPYLKTTPPTPNPHNLSLPNARCQGKLWALMEACDALGVDVGPGMASSQGGVWGGGGVGGADFCCAANSRQPTCLWMVRELRCTACQEWLGGLWSCWEQLDTMWLLLCMALLWE